MPQHLDDKLYVNMVLLLLVFGFACLFVCVFFLWLLSFNSICPAFVRVACAPQDSPFLLVEPAFISREMKGEVHYHEFITMVYTLSPLL